MEKLTRQRKASNEAVQTERRRDSKAWSDVEKLGKQGDRLRVLLARQRKGRQREARSKAGQKGRRRESVWRTVVGVGGGSWETGQSNEG